MNFKEKKMTKRRKIVLLLILAAALALFIVCAVTGGAFNTVDCPECGGTSCDTCGGTGSVRGSAWALLAPVIAIGLALVTKEVFSSLFIGILSGALIYSGFSFFGTVDSVINDGLIAAVTDSAGIFVFLVLLGILVALINKSGGSQAFGEWAKTHIKTRVGAMLATFFLGIFIFVDDYFNCLTVGSVMRPVTDSKRISRAKLSYLIDATAAPICMIAPISSWAAAVSAYAPEGEGIILFIQAIPYNFYSILSLVFIVALALMKFDYGPMRLHEDNAIKFGDLHTSGEYSEAQTPEFSSRGRVIDLVLPIAALVVSSVFALLYVGGILDGNGVIGAFEATDATVALPWGGLVALLFTVIYFLLRKTVSFKDAMDSIPEGFVAMVPAIVILTLATSLKNITSMLGAKYFVGDLMAGGAESLGAFLPAIIFIVAALLSFATGTSWGTFGILIPIVVSIFPEGSELLIIGTSACLAGAVCGDHCSPISDTTVMSSAGGGCNHINHVYTQMPYALTVAALSFVSFLVAGFVESAWISLPIGVVITILTLFVIKKITAKS